MNELTLIQKIIIWAPPVLFAVTLHEAAHGWVANWLGDPTARILGRITLNPLRHIDLFGTLIVPAAMFVSSGMIFGWAKPVPIDWRKLQHPRRDMALVSLAGPLANLAMLLLWIVVIRCAEALGGSHILFSPRVFILMGLAGISVNAALMVLNLLPLPPLDGSRVLMAVLPARLAQACSQFEPYGLTMLLVLLITGILGYILHPVLTVVEEFAHYLLTL